MKKISMIMLALVVALGGLGVGYAMWSDTVTINGYVTTGSVDIDIESLSHTYVYKVVDDIVDEAGDVVHAVGKMICSPTEMDLEQDDPTDLENDLLLVASAVTTGAIATDANYDETAESVTMTLDNIFPTNMATCPIKADVVLHYVGSVPAHVAYKEVFGGTDDLSAYLIQKWYLDKGAGYVEVFPGVDEIQLHNCYRLKLEVMLDGAKLQSDFETGTNTMCLSGTFTKTIVAHQWNETYVWP